MSIFFLFCLGLIIGSFLNVVVVRGEQEESLGGRSYCPQCKHLIAWYDNVPLLSFLLLRGKCRHCQKTIAWQYPLVEFCTGSVFALLGWSFFLALGIQGLEDIVLWRGSNLAPVMILFGLFLLLASVLMAIVVSDIRTMTIPLMWLGVALGGAVLILSVRFFVPEISLEVLPSWESMLWGGGIASALFYALVFFSHETWMGMGDVWVAAILGLTVGGELLLLALTLSFLLGSLVGIVLLALEKKGLKSQIPFAPFLIVATFLTWQIQWVHPVWLEYFLLSPEKFFV